MFTKMPGIYFKLFPSECVGKWVNKSLTRRLLGQITRLCLLLALQTGTALKALASLQEKPFCHDFFTESLLAKQNTDVNNENRAILKITIDSLNFPSEWDLPISNPILRMAIYKAFGGRDFYTSRPIQIEEMVIDHIIPRAKGGRDNIYNYVPTTRYPNIMKSDKGSDHEFIPILLIVRMSFADLVKKEFLRLSSEKSSIATKQIKPTRLKKPRASKPSHNVKSWYFFTWDKIDPDKMEFFAKLYDEVNQQIEALEIREPYGEKYEIKLEDPEWLEILPRTMSSNQTGPQLKFDRVQYLPNGRTKSLLHINLILRTILSIRQMDDVKTNSHMNRDEESINEQLDGNQVAVNDLFVLLVKSYNKEEFLDVLKSGYWLDPYQDLPL